MTQENQTSVEQLGQLELGRTTKLKLAVWKIRRWLRDTFGGKDVLDVEAKQSRAGERTRQAYRKVDAFMIEHFPRLVSDTPREAAVAMVHDKIIELGYDIVEEDISKPWGAYYRMANAQAERFVGEFFPDLSIMEAKMGRSDVEISPKFLLVAAGQRLSWQYHDRRAERWRFLTPGAYFRSHGDTLPSMPVIAQAGEVVQFDVGERHRLCALPDSDAFTLVAEIWQHTQAASPSDEADIVRLQDDYKR